MKFRIVLILTWFGSLLANAQPNEQHVTPGRSNRPVQVTKPYVILISADGFRYDYIDKYEASNIKRLAAGGVRAASMIPSFPSVTFPNHYTIATGLYPSHHGLVYNEFYDPVKKQSYSMGNRKAVEEGSWYGGTPLWVLAEQQGMLSASYFFVGSEAPVKGVYPTYWYTFRDRLPIDDRIATVVQWLSLPKEQRPHFITFYLSEVDHAGHDHGPDAPETGTAVKEVDAAVGKLVDAVGKLGLPVNFIFVADHGMARVDTDFRMDLSDAIDTSAFMVKGGSTTIHLYAKDRNAIPSQYAKLKNLKAPFDTYLKKDLPPAWHYSTTDDRYGRIGDIVAVPHFPKVFSTGNRKIIPGAHGFDPALKEMHAVFCAWGPAFRQGITINSFENVHVYPMVCALLGLTYDHTIDGRKEVLKRILR